MLCQLSYGVAIWSWTGRARTIDPFLIKEVLCRLSYDPVFWELEIRIAGVGFEPTVRGL